MDRILVKDLISGKFLNTNEKCNVTFHCISTGPYYNSLNEGLPRVGWTREHWQNIEGNKGTWAYFWRTGEQNSRNQTQTCRCQLTRPLLSAPTLTQFKNRSCFNLESLGSGAKPLNWKYKKVQSGFYLEHLVTRTGDQKICSEKTVGTWEHRAILEGNRDPLGDPQKVTRHFYWI